MLKVDAITVSRSEFPVLSMANPKKNQLIRRSGLLNMLFAVFIASISIVLLKSFLYSYLLLLLSTTLSSVNLLNLGWKSLFSSLFAKLRNRSPRVDLNLLLMSSSKYLMILIFGVFAYYITAVLFGAPVFESWTATLYFGCFMTALTLYPLCFYCWLTDSEPLNLIIMFLESKYESFSESSLYTLIMCSIIGAWFGAFPIPLDWDRPWQEWPTTCCIGAVLGYAAAHLYIGSLMMWNSYKERRKLPWNIFV